MEGTTATTTTTTSASTAAEETQQQSQQQNQESLIQRGIRGIWGYFAGSAEDAAAASENSGDIKLEDFGAKEVDNSSGEEAGAATSEEDEKSKEVCKFFLEARCRFGDRYVICDACFWRCCWAVADAAKATDRAVVEVAASCGLRSRCCS